MTKRVLIICIIVAVVISIPFLSLFNTSDKTKIISEFNKNANLPYALGLPAASLLDEGEKFIFGKIIGEINSHKNISISISKWPDDRSEYHVTSFNFDSDEYSIYGFTTAFNFDQVTPILKDYGFRLKSKSEITPERTSYLFINKGVIYIHVIVGVNNKISHIAVDLNPPLY